MRDKIIDGETRDRIKEGVREGGKEGERGWGGSEGGRVKDILVHMA